MDYDGVRLDMIIYYDCDNYLNRDVAIHPSLSLSLSNAFISYWISTMKNPENSSPPMLLLTIYILLLLLQFCQVSNAGVTSNYVRKLEAADDMPKQCFPPPPGFNAPEQV